MLYGVSHLPLRGATGFNDRMTTSGRGQVWTGEQLSARLAALRGVAPEISHHVVYRAVVGGLAHAPREGYLVPGESECLAPAAFDFWLARRGVAGEARLAVAVLVVRAGLNQDGELDDCELEFRRGAVDGPYHGSPARITFTGPVRDVRFYQAGPDGQLAEIAPTPDPGTRPGLSDADAAAGGPDVSTALAAWFGQPVRVVAGRAPSVIEAMVGIARVLHLEQRRGRELGCGILWHGPIAVALPAAFPRFDVAPRLSPGQQAALAALLAAERLVVCETRRDDQGLAVLTRRKAAPDLVLVRFDGETPRMTPYVPGLPAGIAEAQAQWVRYIETYEHLQVRDAHHDGQSGALIVMTEGTDGKNWRHGVDEDGVETWRTEVSTAAPEPDAPTPLPAAAPEVAPPAPCDVAPFGTLVGRRFPGASYDIDEAARCLAMGRATAAVFHASRIIGRGLDAAAAWRGEANPPHQHGEQRWRLVVRWIRNDPDCVALYQALDAVRAAWRGTTLQVGPKYTEAEAKQILAQVELFVRCLAGLCDEDGVSAAELDDDVV